MKKFRFLFLSVLFVFSACEEEDISSPSAPVLDAKSRILPAGDPNLDPNWNWESSQWVAYFTNIGGSIGTASTVNPFFNDPIFGNADPSQIDMRASDGWMLVARDFGTPTSAPRHPWIMLYNKYRGLLRVCVLRTSDLLTSDQNLSLEFDSSVVAPTSFIFTGETEQLANTKTGSLQWMVGEFNLQGYDPTINRQARLRVNIREVANQDITLNGGITLIGVAQPKPKPFGVSNLFEIGSYTSKLFDKLPDFGDNTFKDVVKDLTKPELLGAAGGLIKSFTSSGKSPTYNISLVGEIALQGTMSLSTQRGTVDVYLRTDANNSGQYKALNNIPWGVMRYKSEVGIKVQANYVQQIPMWFINYTTPTGFFDNILGINPTLSSQVSSIEAGWVKFEQDNVQLQSLNTFKAQVLREQVQLPLRPWESGNIGEIIDGILKQFEVAVRITYSNGDVVYNRIPVKRIP